MKISTIAAALALAITADAHAIMQKVSVGGSQQGNGFGIRMPSSNNPIENVASDAMSCGGQGAVSGVIGAAPGDRVGFRWQHVLYGPQGSNDADNPIAASHKGPIQVYIAKVDNAASASSSGLKWTKIASEGLNGGKWAVDSMNSNDGWWYFNLPSCLAPGDYLFRSELLALHSAYNYPGAQFYVSCAQMRISGSGSWTGSGNTVSFPGTYQGSDPGIKVSIYGTSGQADNGGRAYTAPGGAVQGCSNGGGTNPQPTTTRTTTAGTTMRTSTTTARTTTTTAGSGSGGSGSPLYGQCGGVNWTGPTTCAQGRCVANGAYYSQCVP